MRALAGLLLAATGPATAATVTSSAPEALSVTIYRDPNRSSGGSLDLDALQGFALVTETRTVSIPVGETVLRFEGVADGILARSAVVIGLPDGVVEKNRDAKLLTPAALLDASIGKAVTLIRTDPATGRVREVRATVRSGPNGVVLETAEGIEALRCSGLPERLVFDAMPDGLSPRPTLSITTRAKAATRVTVTLAYLARDFDWSANYVVKVADDGKTLGLTGWVTLANANDTSFPAARTQVVAGRLNREDEDEDIETKWAPLVAAQCWPWDSTSTYPGWQIYFPTSESAYSPPPMMISALVADAGYDSIIVTGSRVAQEELGDLKLYRVPHATTVAANAQKQVLLIERDNVPFERFYKVDTWAHNTTTARPAKFLLRIDNGRYGRLAAALPSGSAAVFERGGARSLLVGEDAVRDTAIGEKLEIRVGESPDMQYAIAHDDSDDDAYTLTLTNARAVALRAEVTLRVDDDTRIEKAGPRLIMKDGHPFWQITVPANGTRQVKYRVRALD